MDSVFFAVKQAHLAATCFGRRMLSRFGLTPARFDLLVAIGCQGETQRQVRRVLGLARSTVSELVETVVRLGLVKRTRAVDRRTWLLQCTPRGRELLDRAYAECIDSGFVPLSIDRVLASDQPEIDTDTRRFGLIETLMALGGFGERCSLGLYWWHPDDWVDALVWPGDEAREVPFVTQDATGVFAAQPERWNV